jgi:hypothetical protein
MTKKSKLEELKGLVDGREAAEKEAIRDVNRLAGEIEQAQAAWATAVAEGDAAQGTAHKKWLGLKRQHQTALGKVEALQNSKRAVRTSEKLTTLCYDAAHEANERREELQQEKETLISELEALRPQIIDTGLKVLRLQDEQDEIFTATYDMLKKTAGKRTSRFDLQGKGRFQSEIPFLNVVGEAWQKEKYPNRQARPMQTEFIGQSTLLNR